MRAQTHRVDFFGHFVADVGIEHVFGENIATQQVVVIGFEFFDYGFQRAGRALDVGGFF